jgi:hypothetical protein
MLFYDVTLMASRFVDNYRGKTGILSIKFATREQYSQKLRDIKATISNAQKLSRLPHPWYLGDFSIYSPNTSTI